MSEESPKYEEDRVHGPNVHGPRQPYITEKLAAMIVAFDGGDLNLVVRLFDEACEERFEAGIEYAKDTLHDWYRPAE